MEIAFWDPSAPVPCCEGLPVIKHILRVVPPAYVLGKGHQCAFPTSWRGLVQAGDLNINTRYS